MSLTEGVKRENCCDDLAVAICGDVMVYARALAAALIIAVLGLASPPALRGQEETTARFEVADIHRSARATYRFTDLVSSFGDTLRAGRYAVRRTTMLNLIRIAYGVDADKIFGGPTWVDSDQFDIVAKTSPSTPLTQARVMLQALLADRFKLVVRRESRPLPAFALKVGKGPLKMKKADGSGLGGCRASGNGITECRNMTMAAFAEELHDWYGAYITDTLLDATGLEGMWDFDWKSDARLKTPGAEPTRMLDALDNLLDKVVGLALEVKKVPTPVLAIDRVNETPTDNPPGVEKMLPPPPTEFDVATIKPTDPKEVSLLGPSGRARLDPSGRLEIRGMPMSILIAYAFDIPYGPMERMFAEAPKWIESARFDVVAKTTGGQIAPMGPEVRPMVRALLVDRFKLATHYEEKLAPAYTLVAVKPKLRKADPSHRTTCKSSDDPRPKVAWLITCQNITMPQFAERLRSLALQYTNFSDVEDATGLKGAWDFSFGFSDITALSGGRGAAAQTADAVSSDPNGAISLFDAIKTLGLRLEMRKRMMPMLVVDHIEEKPTDN